LSLPVSASDVAEFCGTLAKVIVFNNLDVAWWQLLSSEINSVKESQAQIRSVSVGLHDAGIQVAGGSMVPSDGWFCQQKSP